MLLSLQPSRLLSIGLSILHLGAALCLFVSQAPWWLIVVGSVMVSCSGWYTLRRYALLNDEQAIVRCYVEDEGEWRVKYRNGQERMARLQGDSWRSRHLLLLHVKYIDAPDTNQSWRRWLNRRSGYIVVCSDTLSKQAFRQLQGHLTLNAANSL